MKGFGLYVLILLVLLAAATAALSREQKTTQVVYSDVLDYFNNEEVTEFSIDDNVLHATLKNGQKIQYTIADLNWFYYDLGDTILEQQQDGTLKKIDYTTREIPWWMGMVPYVIIIVLMGLFWYFMMNKQEGGGRGPMQFGRARAKLAQDDKRKVTFQDVAGADEEKAELQEIVEFLKNPQKFVQIGARIPKGVLLVGPPGTGKTLIAKAVAGEAGVPFLSISGSDFVELYVGVGASRVRDLFEQAKKNSPAIVFIDEIDAVGRQRGAGLGGGHDEREQTLNQLLVEMDGFGANEGVIIIAATNRPDILDRALLRPGRFDRQVYVGAPDVKGREQILRVHARNKQFDPDVNFDSIAKGTVGMTGADLENLLNEAALLAARRNKKLITNDEIEDALLKVEMGPEKKSRVVSDKKKRIVAYHEAGHAVSHHAMGTLDPIHYITIIPRGGAGGFTMWRPQEEGGLETKTYFEDSIVTALGGRVAEKLIFDEITTGASGDIRQATAMARAMVVNYGMSDKIGTVDYGDSGEVFIGRDFGATHSYSETKAAEIDAEVHRIIQEAYDRCTKILTDHDKQLHDVAEYLLRNETMDGETFVKIFNGEEVPDKIASAATEEELNHAPAGVNDQPVDQPQSESTADDTSAQDDKTE
ncbi:ATP-dependent zinc metalloprotease FtsH [Intestinibacillus sp. Marseille-P6563]|uniref:ATP-dependent zinc metalloprotease FtsH n=1 Tax=Intestinibacillus sp. Marseille-P6563 TaxID=2364792 RepID=UPI000F06E83C|nr:ATP-dependent zinc metalloprotease FtsH [Intestinibacillus sp. Marseille-P6563]